MCCPVVPTEIFPWAKEQWSRLIYILRYSVPQFLVKVKVLNFTLCISSVLVWKYLLKVKSLLTTEIDLHFPGRGTSAFSCPNVWAPTVIYPCSYPLLKRQTATGGSPIYCWLVCGRFFIIRIECFLKGEAATLAVGLSHLRSLRPTVHSGCHGRRDDEERKGNQNQLWKGECCTFWLFRFESWAQFQESWGKTQLIIFPNAMLSLVHFKGMAADDVECRGKNLQFH